MDELTVSRKEAGARLDRFLAIRLSRFSRARLQTLIRDGFVRLNGQATRPRAIVHPGDNIEVVEPPTEKIEAEAEKIPLQILFEDDDLLVLDKPPGMVVHPGAGNPRHTLVNALLAHCGHLSTIGGKERPGIVHRLDKETSGCLVVAKNDAAHRSLSRQFADRTVEKVYLALVAGTLRRSSGTIAEEIWRHPVKRQRMSVAPARGRTARTDYRVVRAANGISLVECVLHSGRTHQIRVHLQHLGHPVLGDKIYGGKHARAFPRQMLHAWKLGFHHPRDSRWLLCEAPWPEDFLQALPAA